MTTAWVPYCGAAPAAGELWSRWNLDPVLLLALGIAAAVVVLRTQNRTQRIAGGAALVVLAIGFVSPLCALSSALFSARTVHHLLLVTVAAPLLAGVLGRRAGGLAAATAVQAVILWVWHAPAAYAAALSSDLVYWLMQISLLGSAVWFWSALRGRPAPAALAALLATTVQTGLLGAVLTFAPQALYAPHLLSTAAWGLAPLEDQQLAGLLMWAPGAGLYLCAALALLGRRLALAEQGAAAR